MDTPLGKRIALCSGTFICWRIIDFVNYCVRIEITSMAYPNISVACWRTLANWIGQTICVLSTEQECKLLSVGNDSRLFCTSLLELYSKDAIRLTDL